MKTKATIQIPPEGKPHMPTDYTTFISLRDSILLPNWMLLMSIQGSSMVQVLPILFILLHPSYFRTVTKVIRHDKLPTTRNVIKLAESKMQAIDCKSTT